MESNYTNKDFEQYIKQNADQYRMFPSDKVWKGVNNVLHTRRKWYGFWLGFLLLMTGSAVTWVMTIYSPSNKENPPITNDNSGSTQAAKVISIEKATPDIKTLLPFNKESITTRNLVAEKNDLYLPPASAIELSSEAINLLGSPQTLSQAGTNHVATTNTEKELVNNNIRSTAGEAIKSAIIENLYESDQPLATSKTIAQDRQRSADAYYPLTIESVTNAYQHKKQPKQVSWQLFITPTVSYRKLSVNNSMNNPAASNFPFASVTDVNSAVTHKPDLGLQIGVSGRYPITKALKLRGGFQFNINRYDIKAYAFNGEVATIDLNGTNGNSSISTWTYYRNFAGYKSNWLKNYYFSVSVPVGLEIKLIGNKKTNFGIAGTIQPTYIIKDRAYLISTDFKNYAEVPRLVRHVNLNTSFETFVNFSNGKTQWQIGPQVRYQILSSFHNTYPVKENLFDFGVKLGVTLNE
jgi:hypothetical protein